MQPPWKLKSKPFRKGAASYERDGSFNSQKDCLLTGTGYVLYEPQNDAHTLKSRSNCPTPKSRHSVSGTFICLQPSSSVFFPKHPYARKASYEDSKSPLPAILSLHNHTASKYALKQVPIHKPQILLSRVVMLPKPYHDTR